MSEDRVVDQHDEDLKNAVRKTVLLVLSGFSYLFVMIVRKDGGFAVGFKDCGEGNMKLAVRTAGEDEANKVSVQTVDHSVVAGFSSSKIHIGHQLSKSQLKPIAAYLPQE